VGALVVAVAAAASAEVTVSAVGFLVADFHSRFEVAAAAAGSVEMH
jgi:hypothetical protein